MEIVTLRPLYHGGMERIGIYFEKNQTLQSIIRRQKDCKWSKTRRCWHIALSKSNFENLSAALKPHATIHTDALRTYLLEKRGNSTSTTVGAEKIKTIENKENTPQRETRKPADFKLLTSLSEANQKSLTSFKNMMTLTGLSESTVRTYSNEFHVFLQTLNKKSATELTPHQLQRYILYCINELKLSKNTIHSRINALKFYYEQVLHQEKMFFDIPRPKKPQQLPQIFSQDEIAAIINSVKNKKHKAMLMLGYSMGLRVSEIVSIKTYQIDSKRMTIFLSQAKGEKDRVVGLSPVLLVILREYAKEFKPQKNGYLFEGSVPGTQYSSRSVQQVLQNAKKKAGVLKPGSIHALRHSFATHLVEKGTDITMIQKLLGHSNIKTTMIYLHTSNKDLLKIISPLDDLKL